MMSYMKSHLALIIFLFIILLWGGSFLSLSFGLHTTPFNLETVTGDVKLLEDMSFEGCLSDLYHEQKFILDKGKLSSKLDYYETNGPNDSFLVKYPFSSSIVKEDIYYSYDCSFKNLSEDPEYKEPIPDSYNPNFLKQSIFSDEIGLTVHSILRNDECWGDMEFTSLVTLKASSPIFEFYQSIDSQSDYTSDNLYDHRVAESAQLNSSCGALTYFEDKIYFTIPTTPDYSGTNGIYRIDQYEEFMTSTPQKITPLTTFSLDNHNLDIIGLESIEDKLVLLLIEDDIFTLKIFNTLSGELIQTLTLPEIDYSSFIYNSGYSKERFYYESFVDGEHLNLFFVLEDGSASLLSFTLHDEMTLNTYIKKLDLAANESLRLTALDTYYKEGLLFVLCNLSEGVYPGFSESSPSWSPATSYKEKVGIWVYDARTTTCLYKGYIQSDMSSDYRHMDYRKTSSKKSPFSYRSYESFSIKEVPTP